MDSDFQILKITVHESCEWALFFLRLNVWEDDDPNSAIQAQWERGWSSAVYCIASNEIHCITLRGGDDNQRGTDTGLIFIHGISDHCSWSHSHPHMSSKLTALSTFCIMPKFSEKSIWANAHHDMHSHLHKLHLHCTVWIRKYSDISIIRTVR